MTATSDSSSHPTCPKQLAMSLVACACFAAVLFTFVRSNHDVYTWRPSEPVAAPVSYVASLGEPTFAEYRGAPADATAVTAVTEPDHGTH